MHIHIHVTMFNEKIEYKFEKEQGGFGERKGNDAIII